MATYKVPRDVEAEDKLLGPLTFKQFIFFLIAAGAALIAWLMYKVHPLLVLLPLPIILIFGGLAVFRREDQPVERYLLSFFNYMLRPRQRVWDTEGYYDHLVLIQRKKQEPPPLKQDVEQVYGQLEKLAQTVDTRGWSAKRPELTVPNTSTTIASGDDRLFMPDTPQEPAEVHEREDIMSKENPEGMQLDNLLHEQTRQRREELLESIRQQARSGQPADGQRPPRESADVPQPQPAHPADNEDGNRAEAQQPPTTGSADSAQPHHSADTGQNHTQTVAASQQDAAQPDRSDILDMSNELSVSQIAVAANRKKTDDEIQEGEEVQLR